ncbi:MAG: phosphatase PAP2 family protein [Polyangiaceae bacterium]
MSLQSVAKHIKPAEWPVIGLVLYGMIRALFAGHFAIDSKVIPPGNLLIPFLTVITIRLGLEYRELPWPKEFEHRRVLHNVMFVVFMMVGLMCLAFIQPPPHNAGGKIAAGLMAFNATFFSVLICIVAPLFAWILYGLHIKRHGRFQLSFFKEARERLGRDVRAWFPPLALIFAYGLMGFILNRPLFPDRDAELWAIDKALFFGHDPHAWMESIISAPLSEWLAAAYISYTFLFPVVLGGLYAKRDLRPFRELSFAMTFALAVGYVLYTFVPAQGPVFTQTHTTSLDFYYMGGVKEQLMDRRRVPRDCFPSLHTCISLIFLWYAFKHIRWLGWVLAPIVISIPFACVYLRYHYVIDVLAGMVLFGLTVALEQRIFSHETKIGETDALAVAPAADHP